MREKVEITQEMLDRWNHFRWRGKVKEFTLEEAQTFFDKSDQIVRKDILALIKN